LGQTVGLKNLNPIKRIVIKNDIRHNTPVKFIFSY
jgi:hypothetical protein